LDDWPSRIRSVLWGSIPAFIGGLLGYFDGTGKDDFVGLILTLGLACLGSMIAVVLWIPSNTRDAIGTAVFELTAALVWGYISVVAITSALTAPQM